VAITSTRPKIALVKTRWRKAGPRTLEQRAGVIGANVWKVSVEIFRHMEQEGFRFVGDRMATDVIAECIAFLLQLVDRAVYARLAPEDRATLLQELARHVAHTFENNAADLFGPGEHRKPFIDLLNARFEVYATFHYDEGRPGFECLRYFAAQVAEAMAPAENKWVLEQVLEVEAPEMVALVTKLVDQVVPAGPRPT
jgi:hypothetical protein